MSLVGLDTETPGIPERYVPPGGAPAMLSRDARWNGIFWKRLDEASQDMEIIGSALSKDNGPPMRDSSMRCPLPATC